MNQSLRDLISLDPPRFHYWQDSEQTGGFVERHFKFFEDTLLEIQSSLSTKNLNVIETGAGLSTLHFLSQGYRVHSFSLADVLTKIGVFLENYPEESTRWTCIAGQSEIKLPEQYLNGTLTTCQVGLIDGSHSLPSAFLDFTFINLCLENGGILYIDDIQLPGPLYLSNMLNYLENDFTQLGRAGKLVCYRKISSRQFWGNNFKDVDFSS